MLELQEGETPRGLRGDISLPFLAWSSCKLSPCSFLAYPLPHLRWTFPHGARRKSAVHQSPRHAEFIPVLSCISYCITFYTIFSTSGPLRVAYIPTVSIISQILHSKKLDYLKVRLFFWPKGPFLPLRPNDHFYDLLNFRSAANQYTPNSHTNELHFCTLPILVCLFPVNTHCLITTHS